AREPRDGQARPPRRAVRDSRLCLGGRRRPRLGRIIRLPAHAVVAGRSAGRRGDRGLDRAAAVVRRHRRRGGDLVRPHRAGGAAAERLLVNRHPAVKAIAPRFSLYDVYPDIAFPGGVHLTWFTENWARLNRTLDANRLPDDVPWYLRLAIVGVRPVDEDRDG